MAPPEATRRRCLSRPFAAAAALALAVVVAAAALLAAATTTPTAVLAQSTTTTTTTTTAASPPAFTFGAWLNTGEYPTDVDSPAKWNQRLGFPTAAFQMRMSVPPWPGEPQVLQPSDWDDATDAAVFVTAYADSPAYTWPTDADLTAMAQKLHNISVTTKRQVFLRYLPEMDGPWMNYGAQPDQLVTSWKAMAAILRRTAPEVKIVWSPNFDVANRGGAAFWPGAENVDWVGSSQYWKSSQMGYAGNAPVDDGYVAKEIDFVYNTFAVAYNKPFVISEASYAWEIPLGGGSFADTVGQVEAQRGYWSQVFDTAFLDSHPLFRMAFVFEYIKVEDNMFRDFRVSWDPSVRAAVRRSLQTLIAAGRLATARNATAADSSSSSSSSSATSMAEPTSATVSTPPTSAESARPTSSKSGAVGGLGRWAAVVGCAVAAAAVVAVVCV